MIYTFRGNTRALHLRPSCVIYFRSFTKKYVGNVSHVLKFIQFPVTCDVPAEQRKFNETHPSWEARRSFLNRDSGQCFVFNAMF